MAIYEKYYCCQREPFSVSPDPSFLYNSATHREALAELCYLVQERKGFALVTGEVGTGKTLLLRSLMESLAPNVETAYFFNPPHTREALYAALADELDIDLNGHANPAVILNRHFLEIREKGGTVVLIFDEAQSIRPSMLEEIRLLTNLETTHAKLVQVIMAGQPELDVAMDSMELRALRQRLLFRFTLAPLQAEDTGRYIAARLATAGAHTSPFTDEACRAVHHYSRGIPRLINVICGNAMLAGYACDKPIIGEELIDEVIADLKLVGTPHSQHHVLPTDINNNRSVLSSRRRLLVALAIASVLLVMSIATVDAIGDRAAANTFPLIQLQGWFTNALHWLGRGGRNLVRACGWPCI
jgi:general secretion pathway protein A